MDAAEEGKADAGCRLLALSARTLNAAVDLAHENRLTRQQIVMFALADMMTHVEVGAALARQAVAAHAAGRAEANKLCAMSRVFASEVSQLTALAVTRIAHGTGEIAPEVIAAFAEKNRLPELLTGCSQVIRDMDRIADFVFDR
jgi:alkylation response protein AidB-like acyl-CoA dehydrogenase